MNFAGLSPSIAFAYQNRERRLTCACGAEFLTRCMRAKRCPACRSRRKSAWWCQLSPADGKEYHLGVRDGEVVVRKLRRAQKWVIKHNGKLVGPEFPSAKKAMQFVEEGETWG